VAGRRRLIGGVGGTVVLALSPWQIARGATLLAVRVWPAAEYTRVTLEHDAELKFTQFVIRETPPLRLVVDIEGIDLTPTLKELVGKIEADDPFIAAVRIGQNRPRVVRLVLDLKQDIRPQVFAVTPVGPYQYRLVLDLFPTTPSDPLLALLRDREEQGKTLQGSAAADGNGNTASINNASVESDAARNDPARGDTVRKEPLDRRPAEESAADANKAAGAARGADQATAGDPHAAGNSAGSAPKRVHKDDVSRFITIAIDPGHGGEDPGAVGRRGTFEKNVTLSIARRLRKQIEAGSDMRVLLTRDGDFFVPLNARVAKARAVSADLLVSIHADAWVRPDARGSSVFALSERGATSSAAAWLAKRENDADLIGGANLSTQDAGVARVLLDLSTTAQINDSLRFGHAVLRELEHVNRLHKPRVEQAGFAVLKAPDIPSILVETAFISNPDEERRLKDEHYQDQLAGAIFSGITMYFAKNPQTTRNPLG